MGRRGVGREANEEKCSKNKDVKKTPAGRKERREEEKLPSVLKDKKGKMTEE